MPLLNSNQRGFIEFMTKSEEAESDGFMILAKRSDAADYFDTLKESGLLDPVKIKGPTPADREGFVKLPYWPGLDYVEAVARIAGQSNDTGTANKVVALIIDFSQSATADQRQNYNVWYKFSEAIGALPLDTITKPLLAQVKSWLTSNFDRSMVAGALGNNLLPKLIKSDSKEIRFLAVGLLSDLIGIRHVKGNKLGDAESEPDSEVESYRVKDILSKNLAAFIANAPRATADLFKSRLGEVFSDRRSSSSWLYRPAVENHEQNMSWHGAENYTVEGLRDTLIGWLDSDPTAAVPYAMQMYLGDSQIERRIALYLLDVSFPKFQNRVDDFIHVRMFDIELIHETYGFLQHHFEDLSATQKHRVLELIEQIHPASNDEESLGRTERIKLRWLSALAGSGDPKVATSYKTLADKWGQGPEHADFLSYHEISVGPGPSPYSKAELFQLLLDGTLVETLNGFVPRAMWRGPTRRALADTLEEAIKENPVEFLSARASFLNASRTYQHPFLAAYLRLWSSDQATQKGVAWETAWTLIFDWTKALIGQETFWSEPVEADREHAPNRDWIISTIAEIIQAGTRKDNHAFGPELLPQLENVLNKLLTELTPDPIKSVGDAVNTAINSLRGKAIEALVNYSLRCARLADKTGSHEQVWKDRLQSLFDREIELVAKGNDEFVTLFGQYLPHLQYLSQSWVEKNVGKIFVPTSRNFRLALVGLSYAPATDPLFKLLSASGIVDSGMALGDGDDEGRKRLVERLAIATLRGNETIDGTRISAMFSSERVPDLKTISAVFWSARQEQLSTSQIELVRLFWRRCVDWALEHKAQGVQLVSKLMSLVCYLDTLSPEDGRRVLWLAENAGSEDRTFFFSEDLDRLASKEPSVVAPVIVKFVQKTKPFYDHDDHIFSATQKLREAGQINAALAIANELRNIPRFKALFREIRDDHGVTPGSSNNVDPE